MNKMIYELELPKSCLNKFGRRFFVIMRGGFVPILLNDKSIFLLEEILFKGDFY